MYAFTDIKRNGERIPAGTKISRSMLPTEVAKELVASGAIVAFDRNAVENPEPLVVEDEEDSSEGTSTEGE